MIVANAATTPADGGEGPIVEVQAESIHLAYTDTNWIYYEFDWSN